MNRIGKFKQLWGPIFYGAEQALHAECRIFLPPSVLYGIFSSVCHIPFGRDSPRYVSQFLQLFDFYFFF